MFGIFNFKLQGPDSLSKGERSYVVKCSCEKQILLFLSIQPQLHAQSRGDIGNLLVMIDQGGTDKVHRIGETDRQVE